MQLLLHTRLHTHINEFNSISGRTELFIKTKLLCLSSSQKGSPFLEDFNKLLDLSEQMGLKFTENGINNYIPNSTNCMTWQGVKASHEIEDPQVVLSLDDIYGMAILLALGLGVAVMVLCLEYFIKAQKCRCKKPSPAIGRFTYLKCLIRGNY